MDHRGLYLFIIIHLLNLPFHVGYQNFEQYVQLTNATILAIAAKFFS